ncbi:MAG: hypothetical protein M1839_006347 [Geoglossum umbratile]|nr:MAG: hypothetical protein M1839_006347 [Geoglossum umbratile]
MTGVLQMRAATKILLVLIRVFHPIGGPHQFRVLVVCDNWEWPNNNNGHNWEYKAQEMAISIPPGHMEHYWHVAKGDKQNAWSQCYSGWGVEWAGMGVHCRRATRPGRGGTLPAAMAIRRLPEPAVRAIGSSQTLTESSSLVKELIDNALDANAAPIAVEISANPLDVVQVKDNGHKIAAEIGMSWPCTPQVKSVIYRSWRISTGGAWGLEA